jgi:hypothetical protein
MEWKMFLLNKSALKCAKNGVEDGTIEYNCTEMCRNWSGRCYN